MMRGLEAHFDACSTTYRPLARTLVGTGARISEAVALTLGDFDPVAGTLAVNRQLARDTTTASRRRRPRARSTGRSASARSSWPSLTTCWPRAAGAASPWRMALPGRGADARPLMRCTRSLARRTARPSTTGMSRPSAMAASRSAAARAAPHGGGPVAVHGPLARVHARAARALIRAGDVGLLRPLGGGLPRPGRRRHRTRDSRSAALTRSPCMRRGAITRRTALEARHCQGEPPAKRGVRRRRPIASWVVATTGQAPDKHQRCRGARPRGRSASANRARDAARGPARRGRRRGDNGGTGRRRAPASSQPPRRARDEMCRVDSNAIPADEARDTRDLCALHRRCSSESGARERGRAAQRRPSEWTRLRLPRRVAPRRLRGSKRAAA